MMDVGIAGKLQLDLLDCNCIRFFYELTQLK